MRAVAVITLLFFVGLAAGFRTAAGNDRQKTLFFDAVFEHASTTGPPANKVGHRQIASGSLRDAGGHRIGQFAFECRWVESLPNDDARERCSGWGKTLDGRLSFAGPARASDAVHSWSLYGTEGRYRGARGRLFPRDLGDTESLVLATVTPRPGVTIQTAVVARPAANRTFVRQANAICADGITKIAKLPPFPFQNFDPLRPDRATLLNVGQFFSGPGNPRPTLRAVQRKLVGLGLPPASTQAWTRVRGTLAAKVAVFDEQVSAALAGDVKRWVRATKSAIAEQRTLLIAEAVFGSDKCTF
ncbi:MAG: hypothetical protein ACJ76I_13100 [Gaiellaceae bacterium]